ncbi:MAG TPA: hypothetical protein VF053_14580 [Streptosporangiales bacterium]
MAHAAVLVASVAVAVVVVVVAFVVRRPIQDALYPDTGLKEWRATARRLSWSDRWRIYRAVNQVPAVTPRLAPPAVQRARMVLAIADTTRRRGYLWWLFAVETVVVALLIADAANADGALGMFLLYLVELVVYLGAVGAVMRYTVRRAERRADEAMRVNPCSTG